MSGKKIIIPLSEIKKITQENRELNGCDEDDDVTSTGLISVLDNHIYFYTDVTPASVLKLTNIMVKIRNANLADAITKGKDPEEIHLHINSPGGLITSGFMMYDNIMEIKKKIPVYTHIEGQASSAATLLSIAGTKRFITPTSFMLIHEMRTLLYGSFSRIVEEYQNLLKFENKYIQVYLNHSNFEEKELRDFLKRDSIFTAEEAKEKNLVDEIITKIY